MRPRARKKNLLLECLRSVFASIRWLSSTCAISLFAVPMRMKPRESAAYALIFSGSELDSMI
jgi:hypothetical protein